MPISRDPIQIPLAVDFECAPDPGSTTNDDRLISGIVNGLVEINEKNKTFNVIKRRGYASSATPANSTSIKGVKFIQTTGIVAVIYSNSSTNTDHLYYDGSTYDLGIASNPYRYEMTYIKSGTKYYIFIVGAVPSSAGTAGYAWVFEPATTTLTQLVTGTHGFPNTTKYMSRGAVSLDTYAFVLTTDGEIYNSNVGDILTWTSTDFLTTSTADDQKVYICKHHDHILAAGTRTINFYYDAGNPTASPLAIRKDLTIPIGVYGVPSVGYNRSTSINSDDEYAAFIGVSGDMDISTSEQGILGVYLIQNFKLQKISNTFVDQILNNEIATHYIVNIHVAHGRKLIIISSATAFGLFGTGADGRGDLVYDTTTGFWHIWRRGESLHNLSCGITSGQYMGDSLDGSVVKYDFDNGVDYDGTASTYYPFMIQTPRISLGTSNNKLCKDTTILGESTTSTGDTTILEVSWSDNNYNTFSTAREFDLYYYRKLTRCGRFRRRAWKIYQDANNDGFENPIRLSHIEINVTGTTVNVGD